MNEKIEKIEDLLLEAEQKLEDLERLDLAALIMIVRVAEVSGLSKELLEVVRPFYNYTIPWIGEGKP